MLKFRKKGTLLAEAPENGSAVDRLKAKAKEDQEAREARCREKRRAVLLKALHRGPRIREAAVIGLKKAYRLLPTDWEFVLSVEEQEEANGLAAELAELAEMVLSDADRANLHIGYYTNPDRNDMMWRVTKAGIRIQGISRKLSVCLDYQGTYYLADYGETSPRLSAERLVTVVHEEE